MIGFFVIMVATIALAAVVGYTVISTTKTSHVLALSTRNAVRLEQTVDSLAQVIIVDSAGNTFVPMGDDYPDNSTVTGTRTVLPTWVSSMAITPWGVPYGYCPYAVNTYTGIMTSDTVQDSGGSAYAVSTFSAPWVYGANRSYVGDAARVGHASDSLPTPKVLGFLVSPAPNQTKVPPCESIYWSGSNWLVNMPVTGSVAGSVRAITRDGLSDSLSMAPRVLRRYVGQGASGSGLTAIEPADLLSVLSEWSYLKPSRMTIELAAGTYSLDLNSIDLGGNGGQPTSDNLGRTLTLKGTGLVIIEDTGSAGTLNIPIDASLSGLSLSGNAKLRVGPGARVHIQDMDTKAPIIVDGGSLVFSNGEIAPTPTNLEEPLSILGGSATLVGNVNLEAQSQNLSAIVLKGGKLHLEGAITFQRANQQALLPLIAQNSWGSFSASESSTLMIDNLGENLSSYPDRLSRSLAAASLQVGVSMRVNDTCPETSRLAFSTCTVTCDTGLVVSGSCTAKNPTHRLISSDVSETRDSFSCTWYRDFCVLGSGQTCTTVSDTAPNNKATAYCAPIE